MQAGHENQICNHTNHAPPLLQFTIEPAYPATASSRVPDTKWSIRLYTTIYHDFCRTVSTSPRSQARTSFHFHLDTVYYRRASSGTFRLRRGTSLEERHVYTLYTCESYDTV